MIKTDPQPLEIEVEAPKTAMVASAAILGAAFAKLNRQAQAAGEVLQGVPVLAEPAGLWPIAVTAPQEPYAPRWRGDGRDEARKASAALKRAHRGQRRLAEAAVGGWIAPWSVR